MPDTRTKSFGDSGNCQVNVNCSEGNNWQDEKNAVALILVNGYRYCTGSLINNTKQDYRPLFLTADHCLGGPANNNQKYDAVDAPDLNHYSFYWNYESPNCISTNDPPKFSTVGARVLANNPLSDFALLELKEDPLKMTGVIPYYLGWDNSGSSISNGVGIHHPSGDIKKIATLNRPISNNHNGDSNFWSLYWSTTPNGHSVTEGGSSGSPLISSSHHVIGQLLGGSSINCLDPKNDIAVYGKLSVSWTGNNNNDSRRRLRDWLDPIGTNQNTINGLCRLVSVTNISGPIVTVVNSMPTYAASPSTIVGRYDWLVIPEGRGSKISSISGNTAIVQFGNISGFYSVMCRWINGCNAPGMYYSIPVEVQQRNYLYSVSADELNQISISVNSKERNLHNDKKINYILYSQTSGAVLAKGLFLLSEKYLNLNNIPLGVYLLVLDDGTVTESHKIILR